jgi:hypothetical protein
LAQEMVIKIPHYLELLNESSVLYIVNYSYYNNDKIPIYCRCYINLFEYFKYIEVELNYYLSIKTWNLIDYCDIFYVKNPELLILIQFIILTCQTEPVNSISFEVHVEEVLNTVINNYSNNIIEFLSNMYIFTNPIACEVICNSNGNSKSMKELWIRDINQNRKAYIIKRRLPNANDEIDSKISL